MLLGNKLHNKHNSELIMILNKLSLPTANKEAGFTLIELMIVVLIVAVLGFIALPGFRDYSIRAARAEGKAMLVTASSKEEQFFLNNKTYTVTIAGITGLNMATLSESGKYQLSITAGTTGNIATSYLLTATPQGGQTDDLDCYTFTLGSDGTKGIVTGTAAATECW